jgi:hypothetical protein
MNALMERKADNPAELRIVFTSLYRASEARIAVGKAVRITIAEDENDISARQRGFLHAAVLPQIAEQVSVNGVRYTAKVWKEFFKDLFIPDKFDMHRPPFVRDRKTGLLKPSTRAYPVKREKSTEKFGVKGYSDFIDKVIAHAVTEFNVVFVFDEDEREAVRWKRPARKAEGAEA